MAESLYKRLLRASFWGDKDTLASFLLTGWLFSLVLDDVSLPSVCVSVLWFDPVRVGAVSTTDAFVVAEALDAFVEAAAGLG